MEGDPLCTAPRLEPPVQVRHLHHHSEAEAVAVAEHVDVVDDREKRYKNSLIPPVVLVACVVNVETKCLLNANEPPPDVENPPNDNGV